MAGARGSTIAVLALPVRGTSDPFLISPLDYHRRCLDLLSHTLDQVVRFCGGYDGEVTTGGKDCYFIINYVRKECSLFSRVFKVDYAELSDWCDLFLKYVRGPAGDECANETYTEDNCLELLRKATLFLEHVLQAMGPTNLKKVISSTLTSVNKMAESVQDLKVFMERKKYNEETHARNPTQYIQNIVDILDKNQQDKRVKQLLLEIVGPRLNFSIDSSFVQQSKTKPPDVKPKTKRSSITSPVSVLSSEISEELSQQESPVSSPLFQSRSQSISPEVKPIELQRPPADKIKMVKTKPAAQVEPDGAPKQTQGLPLNKLKPSVKSKPVMQVDPNPTTVKCKQIPVTKVKPLAKSTKPITPAKPITPTRSFTPAKPVTPVVKPAPQVQLVSKQDQSTSEENPLPADIPKSEVQTSESNILSKMRSNSVVKSSLQQWNSSTEQERIPPVKPKAQKKLHSPFYNAETWPRLKSVNDKPVDKHPKPQCGSQPAIKPFLKPKPAGNFRRNTLPSKIAKPENKPKPELKIKPQLGSLSSPDLQATQSDSETKSKLMSPSKLQSPSSFGFKPGQPRLAHKYFKMT